MDGSLGTYDLSLRSLADQSRMIRKRQVSSVELVTAALSRIDRLNSTLNAFITVLWTNAMREAQHVDQEINRGAYRGPLHGIPVAVKDLLWTENVLTTGGSQVSRDFVPSEDSANVAALRSSGAVLMGKLNLNEYAAGADGLNPYFGHTRNPWNPDHITGGSSSGSGVAVAASMVAGAIGTDTGGSIRMPAALCGIVGLKPTYGRVSRRRLMTLSFSMDHAGPMTRTVEDAALMLNVLAGWDPGDPTSSRAPVPDYTRSLLQSVKGIRVGVPRQWFFDTVTTEVEEAVRRAIRILENLGAHVQDVDMPFSDNPTFYHSLLSGIDGSAYHLQRVKAVAHHLGPSVRNRMEQHTLYPAVLYVQGQRLRRQITTKMLQVFEKVDVLAMPTMVSPAPTLAEVLAPVKPGTPSSVRALGHNTTLFDDTGFPALTLPCGYSSLGLPLALQIAGRPFEEEVLLRVGAAYQRETDWHLRTPAV